MKNKLFFGIFFFLIGIFFITVFPFVYGKFLKTDDLTFTGLYSLYSDEIFYYLTLGPIQVPDGGFLFEDKYDRVGEGFFFINIIGVIIYIISFTTGLSTEVSFLVYKILTTTLCVFLFVYFLKRHIRNIFSLVISIVFFVFAGGIGWAAIFPMGWDTTAPEMNVFISLTTEYYLPLAILFIIISFGLFLKITEKITYKYTVLLGLSLLFLGVVYIYSLLTLGFFIILYLSYQKLTNSAKYNFSYLLVFVFTIPVIAYYIWLYSTILGHDGRKDGWIYGPTILEYISTYFWHILVLLFLIVLNKKDLYVNKMIQICLLYIVYHFIISRISPPYFPFQVQSYVGLTSIYIFAIALLLSRYNLKRIHKVVIIIFVVFSCYSNVLFYKNILNQIKNMNYPVYIEKREFNGYVKIKELVESRSKIYVCKEKARILSYYTGAFVTYDVMPDSQKGRNFMLWEFFNEFDKTKNYIKELKSYNIDYLYLDLNNKSCTVNDKVLKILISNSKIVYSQNGIMLLEII